MFSKSKSLFYISLKFIKLHFAFVAGMLTGWLEGFIADDEQQHKHEIMRIFSMASNVMVGVGRGWERSGFCVRAKGKRSHHNTAMKYTGANRNYVSTRILQST